MAKLLRILPWGLRRSTLVPLAPPRLRLVGLIAGNPPNHRPHSDYQIQGKDTIDIYFLAKIESSALQVGGFSPLLDLPPARIYGSELRPSPPLLYPQFCGGLGAMPPVSKLCLSRLYIRYKKRKCDEVLKMLETKDQDTDLKYQNQLPKVSMIWYLKYQDDTWSIKYIRYIISKVSINW